VKQYNLYPLFYYLLSSSYFGLHRTDYLVLIRKKIIRIFILVVIHT